MFQLFAFKSADFVLEWFKESNVCAQPDCKKQIHKAQATSMALVTTTWTNQILLFFEASW